MTELPSPFVPDAGDDRWPDPEGGSTGALQADELYKAKLAHIKALRDEEIATRTAEKTAVVAIEKAFLDSVLEVSRERVDRARAGAETVQKAAAAIATLYTGVLGLVFSVTDNPLPARGLIAPALLGLAITFSTVYLAYQSENKMRPHVPEDVPEAAPTARERLRSLARAFVDWARDQSREKLYWLRVSVLMLGIAVFFLPAPFISFVDAKSDAAAAAQGAVDGEAPEGSTTAQAALEKLTPYPEPPAGDSQTERTRYRAEVAEIRAIRQEELKPDSARKGYDEWWAIAAILCVITALVLPKVAAALRARQDPQEEAPATT